MAGRAAATGVLGIGTFLGALALLHALTWPDVPRHISSFAHTRWAPLWYLALAGLVVGGLGLARALRPLVPDGSGAWAPRFLGAASFLPVVLAIAPTDRTWTPDHVTSLAGTLHDTAAITMVLELCAGMLFLTWAGLTYPDVARIAGPRLFAAGAITLFLAWMVDEGFRHGVASGLLQRLLLGLVAVWLLRASWLLRSPGWPETAARRRPAEAHRSSASQG